MAMTRREWLSAAPASWTALHAAAQPDFQRIDTHMHVHWHAPPLIAAMEKSGWRGLSICDSREMDDEPSVLDQMTLGTQSAVRRSEGRLAWAATFDPRGFESPDFAERTIESLRQAFAKGAAGVKIWKNIGMGVKSKSGQYLLPDNPVFTPVYAAIERAGKTLLAHLADPDAAWGTLDPADPESAYFRSHPEWHMRGRRGAPSKEQILAARDRVLARHPRLRVIGCHFGSSEGNLDRVAKWLDRYPNFAVDMAARVRYLAREKRETAQAFLRNYSDRVLYATDFQLRDGDHEAAARSFLLTHDSEWDFLSRQDTLQFRGQEVRGLGLPDGVLRGIFRDNAVRWLPGAW
jgi:predicted TIM-barrel fold metal-dependent hydrolase